MAPADHMADCSSLMPSGGSYPLSLAQGKIKAHSRVAAEGGSLVQPYKVEKSSAEPLSREPPVCMFSALLWDVSLGMKSKDKYITGSRAVEMS